MAKLNLSPCAVSSSLAFSFTDPIGTPILVTVASPSSLTPVPIPISIKESVIAGGSFMSVI